MVSTGLSGTRFDWMTPPVTVTNTEAHFLFEAALSGDCALYGEHTSERDARTARALRDQGCVQYFTGKDCGWEAGMWGAYLTCVGWNAMWRFFGDIHTDGHCGQAWRPDGLCGGCGAKRYLDAQAWADRLATLVPADRERETARSRLWCPEHGFIRAADVRTDKVCQLAGSTRHDGGLNRVGRA
jgi:hypothetical protein